jgi:hypothetical protein
VPSPRPDPFDASLSRRQVLGLGAAAVASTVLPASPAGAGPRYAAGRQAVTGPEALRPQIHPRSDWAGGLGVKGELQAEQDVRFLLVHHTASTNDYAQADVAGQIRGFYEYHTGPEKGWADVAYNFFVDRYGGIWEGRQGSLAGPVRGDATGGSQGFALLCSLIGDNQAQPVTDEQQAGLVKLLAWLAETYRIDTSPGATVSFESRGSNLWPAGSEVTATTIAGHRDVSQTSCPGDLAYSLLATDLPTRVTELRASVAAGTTSTAPPDETASTSTSAAGEAPGVPGTSAQATADGSTAATLGSATATGAGSAQSSGVSGEGASEVAAAPSAGSGSGGGPSWALVVVSGVAAAAAAGAAFASRLWRRAS